MTAQESRALQLRALVEKHRLTYADVAELTEASVKTVEGWLADPEAASHRQIKPAALELLKMRLKARRKGRK